MAYPNNWVDDGKVWVYYNITDISSATTILNQTTGIGATMNVDGTDVALASSYQFSATGEHLIKYGFSGSTWGQQLRNIKTITKIYFPSNVTTVGSQAFQGSSIQECYGEGVTTIGGIAAGWGGGAFTQVTSLTLLDFPNLTTIQRGGCYQCTNLETFNGLENVTTLVGYGIARCSKLGGAITFKLTELPNPGLNDLGFTHIYLPNVVTSNGGSGTGNNGIGACHSLQYVEFGAGITSIGGYNLGHCENLKRVVIRATTPPTLANGFLYNNSTALIYVPAESVQAYKEAEVWSNFASRIYAIGDEKRLNINHMSLGDFRRRIMLGISNPIIPNYFYVQDESGQGGEIWFPGRNTPTINLIECSTDLENWTSYPSISTSTKITLPAGGRVYFRGTNTGIATSNSSWRWLQCDVAHSVGGRLEYLLDKSGHPETVSQYAFKSFFNFYNADNTTLVDASKLTLKILGSATEFYRSMFERCTALTKGPFIDMDYIPTRACQQLFYNCSSLQEVKCTATNISGSYTTTSWMQGVAATGTFYKAATMTSWPRNGNGIPSGWTVVDL